MLTYPWKCTVLHCNTWETPGNHWCWWPNTLIITLASARAIIKVSGSSAPVVSRCFPGGYNVKLYISRGRLAWWLLAFLQQCVLSGIMWQHWTTFITVTWQFPIHGTQVGDYSLCVTLYTWCNMAHSSLSLSHLVPRVVALGRFSISLFATSDIRSMWTMTYVCLSLLYWLY